MSPLDDSSEFGSWLQALIARSLRDQIETIQRYGELLKLAARGEPDERAVRDRYLEFVRQRGSGFANALATASLSYYERLQQLNRSFNHEFFDQVLGNGHVPASGDRAAAEGEVTRVEMALSGALGGTVSGSFIVENKRAARAEIAFDVSEFSGPGGVSVRAPLEIVPARFSLAPLEAQSIQLRLALLPTVFAPGSYRALIKLLDQEGLEVALVVMVQPGPPETAPAAAAEPATAAEPLRASTPTAGAEAKAVTKQRTAREPESTTSAEAKTAPKPRATPKAKTTSKAAAKPKAPPSPQAKAGTRAKAMAKTGRPSDKAAAAGGARSGRPPAGRGRPSGGAGRSSGVRGSGAPSHDGT